MQIILASQSPRRQELLKRVVPTLRLHQPTSMKLLAKTAYQQNMWRKWLPKSSGYSRAIPEALVIGCDTIVALAERSSANPLLGKTVIACCAS